MNKEQMKQFILNNDVEKYPLLNEIFAIRDTRKEQVDYTIYVDGYISVDVLNKALEQQAEIEKKDKTVKHIIERLENDIKRITETKTKKSEHYLDDYTRNRLKAYKTKTKEIKEYIEEQYFERRIEQ